MTTLTAPHDLATLSDADLQALANELLNLQAKDHQENALLYYKPVNPMAAKVHASTKRTIGIGGGNGSSKTETALVELLIRATGVIPFSLRDTFPREKLRGPIAGRVVCESLTTTLVPIILPKLQYWRWNGVSEHGGPKGHWGWIPRSHLIGGAWRLSWNEKLRLLRVLYRDPDTGISKGESYIQFMSYDQDPTDFASGDFHFVLHDEPPRKAIWDENMARVMRVDGTLMVAMTWPDDPAIAVDWILDDIYDRAQPGPQHDPNIEWYTLYTTDNPHLNQTAVAERAGQMSVTSRQARIFGQPISLSNRVHPSFTDQRRWWCFTCHEPVIPGDGCRCVTCGNEVLVYTHVDTVVANPNWPVIYALDPHPRKPHCMIWVQVDPNDDLQQVDEREVDGGPEAVWETVKTVESLYGWTSVTRLMDPNMGASPSDTLRELTWQNAFERVGLRCDLADDAGVGMKVLDEYLKPDERLRRPRVLIDPRCVKTVYQFKRYLWGDYKKGGDRDQKQAPKDKHNDMPTLWKYIVNADPSFRGLRGIGQIFRRAGQRGVLGY